MSRKIASRNLYSIAGYDPSAGAGVLLDIKVFESSGFRGCGILTAVTAQNTARVSEMVPLKPELILKQYELLVEEARPSGIKVGMLGNQDNLRLVASLLEKNQGVPRVVDPVIRSSSGQALLDKQGLETLLEELKGRAELITPNLDEASFLAGIRIKNLAGSKKAARLIYKRSGLPCLIKGVQVQDKIFDVLYDGQKIYYFSHSRIKKNVHGTGCFLSSTILVNLALGFPLKQSCSRAIQSTLKAIRRATVRLAGRAAIKF